MPETPPEGRNTVAAALAVNAAAVAVGAALVRVADRWPLDEVQASVFYVLHREHDPLMLSVLLLVLAGAAGIFFGRPFRAGWLSCGRLPRRPPVAVLAALVLVLSWIGFHLVFHGYPLSMDEATSELQAEIFASGDLTAAVPAAWQPYVGAMTQIFVQYHPDTGSWHSTYLPVYSLMRAATLLVHPGLLLNPLLAALSVWLIARLAERLWPERPAAPWLAVLFLVTSAQFLVTSMTLYSMPAHLALNLLWLLLYLRDDRLGWGVLPWIGVLSMGLHQYAMHAVFAAPFLLRQVIERRVGRCLWLGLVYGGGLAGWIAWMGHWRLDDNAAVVQSVVALPGLRQWLDQGLNLVALLTWQAPGLGVLAVLAVLEWRRLSKPLRDVTASLAFSALFYVFITINQGHGWGYRYLHPALGNLVLLAVAGAFVLRRRLGERRGRHAVALFLLAAVLVQLPLHLLQTSTFARPFADAWHLLRSEPADVVVFDATASWYGWDLLRNDPYLDDGPVVVDSRRLRGEDLEALKRRGTLRVVTPAELAKVGLVPLVEEAERVRVRP